jgi:hypothetical protein
VNLVRFQLMLFGGEESRFAGSIDSKLVAVAIADRIALTLIGFDRANIRYSLIEIAVISAVIDAVCAFHKNQWIIKLL